jgi:hypothetical protein
MAYYIYSQNRRYDKAKEKLKNLYNPLNALIEKRSKYLTFLKMRDKPRYEIEYYKFFLELRDIYLDQASYGTHELERAFHTLRHTHEVEYHNVDKGNPSEDEMIESIAHFELNHDINQDDDSEFERKIEALIQIISAEQNHLYEEIHIRKSGKQA